MLRWSQRIGFIVVCGVLIWTSRVAAAQPANRPPPREKMIISEVPGGLALPGNTKRKSLTDESALQFLDGRSSVSGVVTPYGASAPVAAAPSAKAAQKMLEKLDREKNWMFQNQGSDVKGAVSDLEEANQPPEYELTKSGPRKGSVQRYLESQPSYRNAATNSTASAGSERREDQFSLRYDRNSQANIDASGFSSRENTRSESSPLKRERDSNGNMAARSAFDAVRGVPGDGNLMSGLRRSLTSTLAERNLAASEQEFRKLLEPPGGNSAQAGNLANNPLGGILDPVNLAPDLTRRELNPVVPNMLPDLSPAGSRGIFDGVRGMNTANLAGRANPFLDAARPLGASSLAPSVIETPKPVPAMAPAVLELPRRGR